MASTLTRRLIGEGVWVALGQLAAAMGTLLGVRILTEILPPHVFGELVLLTGIGALLLGLTAAPLMQAVLRYYPEAKATNSVAVLRMVVMRHARRLMLVIGLVCLGGGLVYGRMAVVSPWLGLLLMVLLAVELLRQVEVTLFSAARRQKPTAIWLAAEAWIRPALAWVAVMLTGTTATASLSGYVAASLIIFAVFALGTDREGLQKAENDSKNDATHCGSGTQTIDSMEQFAQKERHLSDALIRYALPLLPLGLIGWITGQADRYLIGGMFGIEQAGLYAAIYGTVSRPFIMAGGVLEALVRPVYYETVLANDPVRERLILHAWILAAMGAALTGFVVFSLWNEEIASALLAQPYRANAALMPWIAAGYGLLLIAQVFVRVCYAHKDTKAVLATETIGCVFALTITIATLRHFGMAGAAYAVPVYFSFQLAVAVILARRADKRSRSVSVMVHQSSLT